MAAPRVKTKYPGIYRRGSRYSFRYTKPNGRTGWGSAATLGEARARRAELEADVARGEYREASRLTFAEYAPEWIAAYAGRTGRGFRETTREEYRRDLGLDKEGRPLEPARGAIAFFGRLRLGEIEPRHVKRYVRELLEQGLAPATVRNALAPVRACLADAVEEGLLRRGNPAAGIRVPARPGTREQVDRARALTLDEAARLLAAVDPAHGLFVEFLLQTGLRFSEAIALQWADVDFGRRRVQVRRRAYRGIDEPKSRHSRRDVPLAAPMSQRLWELRKAASNPEGGLVFTSGSGGMLDYANLYNRVLKPAARAAGVPWVAFHTLRHTCATLLFTRQGLNAKQVQHWLGHHSAAFTLDTYVHLLADDLPQPTTFEFSIEKQVTTPRTVIAESR
jgi:integrase